jgi:hypothetical protein
MAIRAADFTAMARLCATRTPLRFGWRTDVWTMMTIMSTARGIVTAVVAQSTQIEARPKNCSKLHGSASGPPVNTISGIFLEDIYSKRFITLLKLKI